MIFVYSNTAWYHNTGGFKTNHAMVKRKTRPGLPARNDADYRSVYEPREVDAHATGGPRGRTNGNDRTSVRRGLKEMHDALNGSSGRTVGARQSRGDRDASRVDQRNG